MILRERITTGEWIAPWLRHQHIARYEWAAALCKGKRVLDAASANGYGAMKLVEAGADAVVAVDIAFEPIGEGRVLYRCAGLSFAAGDGTQLPFKSAAFDVFVSFETIEHVRSDRRYVEEARRVLVSGGLFLCSTPNRKLVNAGNALEDKPFNPFHVREYAQNELAAVLASSFTSVQWFGQSAYARPYARMLGSVGYRWRTGAIRMHQMRKLAGMPFESIARHRPFPLPIDGEPEVLLAVCR